MTLDEIDLAILRHIQNDARINNSKLAEKVNLSETPCWRRWKRLEEAGYIDGYRALLNRKKLGIQISSFTLITMGNHEEESTLPFEEFAKETEWIVMCHCISGGADYMVHLVAKDMDEFFERISSLRRIKGVSGLQSNISVKEIKSGTQMPLS